MAEEKTDEVKAAEVKAGEVKKEGPGCFAIGFIVVLVVIVVGFGLLVGVCGIKF